MSETVPFMIGAEAEADDGVCGEVTRVVVDPVASAVTHIVVEPKHRRGLGRLVPLDLLDPLGEAVADRVRVRCSMASFDKLNPAEETHFIEGSGGFGGYQPGQALFRPYYGLGMGGQLGPGGGPGMGLGLGNTTAPEVVDTVPLGEVAVRRGQAVHATDGPIGRVQGLIVDPANRHVTHVLLQEGHLWGRKQVAIPIGVVTRVDKGIILSITKHTVQELPAVDLDDPLPGTVDDPRRA